jgi:hypothetical protein
MSNNTTKIVLAFILILSFLGINILFFAGHVIEEVFEFFQNIVNIFTGFFKKILSDLGFISGTVINNSSDIVSNAAKGGIDVANGVVHDIGNIAIHSSGKNGNTDSPVNIHTQNADQLLSELANIRLGELPDYNVPDLKPVVLNEIPDPTFPGLNNIKIPDLDEIRSQLTPYDFVIDSSVRVTRPGSCNQTPNVTQTPFMTTSAPSVGSTSDAHDNSSGWYFRTSCFR